MDIQAHPEHLVDPIREEYLGAAEPPDKIALAELIKKTEDRPEPEF